MLFFYIAAFLEFFGKSIFAVRISAMLCVGVISYCVYSISRMKFDFFAALAAGLLTTALLSVFEAQAMYSETLSLAFIMVALNIFLTSESNLRRSVLTGILIGSAILTRSNMFPLSVLFLVFFVLRSSGSPWKTWMNVIAYVFGGLVPLIVVVA